MYIYIWRLRYILFISCWNNNDNVTWPSYCVRDFGCYYRRGGKPFHIRRLLLAGACYICAFEQEQLRTCASLRNEIQVTTDCRETIKKIKKQGNLSFRFPFWRTAWRRRRREVGRNRDDLCLDSVPSSQEKWNPRLCGTAAVNHSSIEPAQAVSRRPVWQVRNVLALFWGCSAPVDNLSWRSLTYIHPFEALVSSQ